MKVTKYRINGVSEETQCDHCGTPLDSGDKAILVETIEVDCVVCSETCKTAFFAEGNWKWGSVAVNRR